ncbi:MAG TPA: tetratricopeptide repeat protein [Methyloceanibacter sp.]|nr:tetratricopeptide repeat protein [Methyloceanibacter sp.]
MAHALRSDCRRSVALALLATTAVAVLLGGCSQAGGLFSREPKLAAADSIGAISQWSAAYAKKPNDPKMALGYAKALKAIGSRDRALEVLTAGYRANPTHGELAAELGRLALDMGRLDIATQTLKVAEAQGVRDWRTLSAQGTLRARQGQHAEAQQYFLAALQEEPDAVPVINNLALSYALDGKPERAEELLRKAVASGHEDKRVRQNLALVLGLQGKFEEARQIASVDIGERDANMNIAYLRNMVSNSSQVATAAPEESDNDWTPFAANETPGTAAIGKTAATTAANPPAAAKVQVVKAEEKVEAPSVPAGTAPTQRATATKSAKLDQLAGSPTLIAPVPAAATKSKPAPSLASP